MTQPYQYVRVYRPYFCLQQNPLALARFLYFGGRSIRRDLLRLGRGTAAGAIAAILQRRLLRRGGEAVLALPFYGNVCLPVHRGYKLFDFQRNRVIKVFASDVAAATVAGEIEAVRTASQTCCAPKIHRWSVADKWYEEDFVAGDQGHLVTRPESTFELYRRDIEPCLARLILLQAPVRANLADYLDQLAGMLAADRLSQLRLDEEIILAIERCVESAAEPLRRQGERSIDLVFSHGDFSLRNIVRMKRGIAVVDWENAGRRSPLCDLYNFFFTELYYERTNLNTAKAHMDEAIASMQACLSAQASPLASGLLASAPLYRALYYFERVQVLLSRELNDRRLNVLMRSIAIFDQFEAAFAYHGLEV
jgi:aminoglycoside phosphotransferase